MMLAEYGAWHGMGDDANSEGPLSAGKCSGVIFNFRAMWTVRMGI